MQHLVENIKRSNYHGGNETDVITDIEFTENNVPDPMNWTNIDNNSKILSDTNTEIQQNNRFVERIVANNMNMANNSANYSANNFANYSANNSANYSANHLANHLEPNLNISNMMTGGDDGMDMDKYENELQAIFDKAREYNKRIADEIAMTGGEGEKKTKKLPPTIIAMHKISKEMKKTSGLGINKMGEYMKVSKMILDDAKSKLGKTELDDAVERKALELAQHPEKYVDEYLKNSGKAEKSSNFRKNSNDRNSRDSDDNPWNNRDYTWDKANASKGFDNDRVSKKYSKRGMY